MKKIKYAGLFDLKLFSEGAVGYDLASVEDVLVQPYNTVKINTGCRLEMPKDIFAHVMPRSGISLKYSLLVIPGTIDSDYRGEISVIVHNLAAETAQIFKGQRIAQLLFYGIPKFSLVKADFLSDTARGENGFGSTGV